MVQRMLGAEQSGAARLLKINELVSGEGKRLGDVFKDYGAAATATSRAPRPQWRSRPRLRPKFTKAEITALVDFIDADGSTSTLPRWERVRGCALAREIPGASAAPRARSARLWQSQLANAVNVLLELAAERGEGGGLTIEALQKAIDNAGARADESASRRSLLRRCLRGRRPRRRRRGSGRRTSPRPSRAKAGSVRCVSDVARPAGSRRRESMNEEARVAAVLQKKKAGVAPDRTALERG